METCFETRLHVVPKRLPRDLGKVGGSGESPRALPEEAPWRAFLCDGGWRRDWNLVRISARARGASLHHIGRRTRRPSRARLGGSLLEGLRRCQHHEGGARAPLGGVLHGTFPSGGVTALELLVVNCMKAFMSSCLIQMNLNWG